MEKIKIGVIGGTGLYEIDGLDNIEELNIDTPFGKPSDKIITGAIGGVNVAFLARHGKGHRILPTEIPVRANIYALKKLGVETLVSVSAVGSLKQELVPRDIVLPNQIIDRTKSRVNTFFGNGLVVHAGFANPFCDELRQLINNISSKIDCTIHFGGTYVCMEGPLFSTKAESNLHRSWGASIIGMTILPEAKLAREAEMCYASIALVTDYDCWREEEEAVNITEIMENLQFNSKNAKEILKLTIPEIDTEKKCICNEALKTAIITPRDLVPEETYNKVKILVDKYI